jgi:hypothetical protein
MERWHQSDCKTPKVVFDSDGSTIHCKTCSESIRPNEVLPPPSYYHILPVLPPNEPLGKLNLRWPSCVPYHSAQDRASFQKDEKNKDADTESALLQVEDSAVYGMPLRSDEFRLLRLSPVENEERPVHVELQTYSHDNCPEYETVSYTWGGEEGDSRLQKPVFIGPFWDLLFQTKNCWEMLNLLRPLEGNRYLWVDAICINQRNTKEKENQVAKMAHIYEEALRVVVHLGQDLVSPVPYGSYPMRRKLHDLQNQLIEGVSLEDVLNRKYFSRVWVVQELIMSKYAVIRIGAIEFWVNHVTSKDLQSTDMNFNWNKTAAPWFQHVATRQLPGSGKDQFYNMLNLTRASQATDERDKVFALLGVLEDQEQIIRPDYSLSVNHVFIGIFAHLLLNLVDLRVLSNASGLHSSDFCPSWTPGWSLIKSLNHEVDLNTKTFRWWTRRW